MSYRKYKCTDFLVLDKENAYVVITTLYFSYQLAQAYYCIDSCQHMHEPFD